MGIGNKIKEQRIKNKLTQKQVAEQLFVTTQAVSRWENDETEPDIETLKTLADLFSISVDVLLGTKEPEDITFTPKTNLSKKQYLFYFSLYGFVFLLICIPVIFIGVREFNVSILVVYGILDLLCLGTAIFYLRKYSKVSRLKEIHYGRIVGVTVFRFYRVSFCGENKTYQQSLLFLRKYKFITNQPCAYVVDKKGKAYLIDIMQKD